MIVAGQFFLRGVVNGVLVVVQLNALLLMQVNGQT